MNTYTKLIVIRIDLFESTIEDERHFNSRSDALAYFRITYDALKYVPVIVEM